MTMVGVELDETEIADGDDIIVDAVKGEIILKPSEEELSRYKEQVQKQEEQRKYLMGKAKQPAVTTDGKRNTGICKYQQTNRHGKGSRVWMPWSRTIPDRVFIYGIGTASG